MARRIPQDSHLTASRPAHGSAQHCPLHSPQHLHSPACVPRLFPLSRPNFSARQKLTRTSGDAALAKRGCAAPLRRMPRDSRGTPSQSPAPGGGTETRGEPRARSGPPAAPSEPLPRLLRDGPGDAEAPGRLRTTASETTDPAFCIIIIMTIHINDLL